jgi:RNA polymerase sigma-70 factor (ECF subfamily)
MTDEEIKEKLHLGDPTIINWLFQNYYTGLCTYAHRFTKNKSISEEIVQQSFFKFWEKKETLQINETVIGYLFRIVRNNCLNHIKHQQIINRYNEKYLEKLNESEDLLNLSQETGLSIYIAKELEDKINGAIENLPAQCREIFKLSRFEGLKHLEIAEIQGITVNTVQKQISIALSKLRIELSAYLSIIITLVIKAIEKF